jgi:hypothetical protein
MAINKYSQAPQIQPIDVFDEETVAKALTIKQLKYDQGVQQTQLMLNQTSSLDIINNTQKEYLNEKVQSVLEKANTFSGIDFSNTTETSNINSLISGVTDDPVIRNALVSSSKYREYIKNKKLLLENPKNAGFKNALLIQHDEKKEVNYLNSQDLNASWKQTMPSLDSGFDKEVYTKSNEVKTTKGTRFLQGGKSKQDYQLRTDSMMLLAVRDSTLENPEHSAMLTIEYGEIYDTDEKKQTLFNRGMGVEKLKYTSMLKELTAQQATDSSEELKTEISKVETYLKKLGNTSFSDESTMEMYFNQRLNSALAPEININDVVKENLGYYKDQEFGLTSRKFAWERQMDNKNLELEVDKMFMDKNSNYTREMAIKYDIPSHMLDSPTLTDNSVTVPEEGVTIKSFTNKIQTKADNSNAQFQNGLLSIISKGNTEFYAELKNTGALGEIESGKPLGKSAIRVLRVLQERLQHKEQEGQPLSSLEADFSKLYTNYKRSSYLVNSMKQAKEDIIRPIVESYGHTYEDWIQYNIDKKDEGGFFSNMFSTKEGIATDISEIGKEIENKFSESNLNTFNPNNKFYAFDAKPSENTKSMVLNEIRNNGLMSGEKAYSINDPLSESHTVLSNVDSDKVKFVKFNPNTNIATVEIQSKINDKANIGTYTVKMSDDVTGKLSMEKSGIPYNSSYENEDEDLDKFLKSQKTLMYDGKQLGFDLSSIAGNIPFSNQVYYNYDSHSGTVGVTISGFGTFNFRNGTAPVTIKDAEGKIGGMISSVFSDLKSKNPKATQKELMDETFKFLKDNGYAYN